MYDIFMFQWLKDHFIAHEGNDHRPKILHKKNVHRIIGFVLFVEVFAFLIPSIAIVGKADGTILPTVLSELTNQQRVEQNLPPLTISPLLNQAAQEKADDMAQNGYFAHTSPDGKTPWYWLDQVGYNYSYAGENLAVNFTDSQDVTAAWMNSPEHRANILKANYTEVGTGVAEGMYDGNETIFVAQDFGTPVVTAPLAEAAGQSGAAAAKTNSITAAAPAAEKVLGAQTIAKAPIKPAKPVIEAPVQAGAPTVAAVAPTIEQPAVVAAPIVQPTFWQKLLASPRNTTNVILFVILTAVALAVFLNIGNKLSRQHPALILNGMMVIAVIGSAFVMNSYISQSNSTIVQSIDYNSAHTVLE
jgi:hypothetical protein